jgi:hypothetical protein
MMLSPVTAARVESPGLRLNDKRHVVVRCAERRSVRRRQSPMNNTAIDRRIAAIIACASKMTCSDVMLPFVLVKSLTFECLIDRCPAVIDAIRLAIFRRKPACQIPHLIPIYSLHATCQAALTSRHVRCDMAPFLIQQPLLTDCVVVWLLYGAPST